MTERTRSVTSDLFWRCGTCGTPNPSRSYLTRCLGCGAPASGGVVLAEADPKVSAPRRRGRWIVLASWSYAALVLTVLALINWVGEAWWGVTVLLFLPRWLFLGPVLVLVLASAMMRRPSHWILQGTIGLVVAGPLMGFSLSSERLWKRRVEGTPFRILSYNVGPHLVDAEGLIRMIERERIDLISFQEGVGANPALEAYLAKGWYRDRTNFVASRHPIVTDLDPMKDTSVPNGPYGARLSRVRVRTAPGLEFLVASVHMPTIRPGLYRFLEGDTSGLTFQVNWWRSELGRVVSALRASGDAPILIGGDFNMPSDDSSMATLRSFFRFAFEEAGVGYGYTRPSRTPWFRIDHILTSPQWNVTRCWVGPDFGSDHLPLIAEVILPRTVRPAVAAVR
jgi:vancomycin resistance protein VanJ